MCGIAGIVSNGNLPQDAASAAVRRMTDYMKPRGPDAEGQWAGTGVVLGHRRLAILDIDARANQPMVSANQRYCIVFNGEIYNFRELRRVLETNNRPFRTASDTEVLLELFAIEGEAMLPKLRGMFAFAIWDTETRELFLARDPYGIKPLYYSQTQDGLAFASQVKALRASGLMPANLEPAGLAGFYLWGSVPEPWTLYRNVLALPAGHCLRVNAHGIAGSPTVWHDIRQHWRDEGCALPAHELQERVRQALNDSIRSHLISDTPVSVFLSGGIDSAAVAGLASAMGLHTEGITIGFEEFSGRLDDEVPIARAIADHYQLPHHVHTVSRAEFEEDLPRILAAMDQPSVDGVNTWFASKTAAERGFKVVLSGVGGDELFCGYSGFRQLPRQAFVGKILAKIPGMEALLTPSCRYLAKRRLQPKFSSLPDFMDSLEGLYFLTRCLFLPAELTDLMEEDFAREGLVRLGGSPPGMVCAQGRDSLASVGLLESTYYLRNQLLRDSDWASMAHSLELRTPLVDAKLLQNLAPYVSSFGAGAGKRMLAYAPSKPLPDVVIQRPKTGFGVPMTKWLSESLSPSVAMHRSVLGKSWARQWAKIIVDKMWS